jgi:hypothetical protein
LGGAFERRFSVACMSSHRPQRPTSTVARRLLATVLVAVAVLGGAITGDGAARASGRDAQVGAGAPSPVRTSPQVLRGGVADVLVRVLGGGNCSGTPITGTNYVVTAAHCILDEEGEVDARTVVVRDGIEFKVTSALVDVRYHDEPSAELDAAVLIMEREIPGPSARLGSALPAHGTVTLAGYQLIDTDGTLLRGTGPHDRPHANVDAGTTTELDVLPAGCVTSAEAVVVSPSSLTVPCGLIPGASGGGLITELDGEPVLLGIISTVAADLSYNRLVSLPALERLLAHPGEFTHELTGVEPAGAQSVTARS